MPKADRLFLEATLDPGVTAPQEARRLLRGALRTWELDGLGFVTELLASELVTNAVRHVHEPFTLRASAAPDRSVLRVEVDDPSPAEPLVQHPPSDAEGGRGMQMVDS